MATPEITAGTSDCCAPEQRLPKPALPLWVLAPAALAFVAVAVVYAFSITFSQFAPYDDQGSMMVCIRGYLEGHPLYDSVRLMYGPFYFMYEALLHRVTGAPVTHDVTGIICIIHWLGAASVLAVAGGLMTRSALFGIFVFMQATVHLRHVAREPGSPQEFVILALALAILLVAVGSQRGWVLTLLGTIGAALLFTKVNVGAFFGVALLMALSSYTSLLQARRSLFWGILVLGGSFPFVLMRGHLEEASARDYAVAVSVCVITTSLFTYTSGDKSRLGLREWFQVGVSFGVASMLLLLMVLANGTSLWALVHSTIIVPAGMTDPRNHPLTIPSAVWGGAAALLMAAVGMGIRAYWSRVSVPIALLKAAYGLIGCFLLVTEPRIQLGYLLPWLWLALIQVPRNSCGRPRDLFPRAMLCLFAGWQGLQAYPMPGTQVCVATFLSVLVYSLCLRDAWEELGAKPRVGQHLGFLTPRTTVLVPGLVLSSLLYLFVVQWCMLPWQWLYYTSGQRLDLRGARYLRLADANRVEAYRSLAQYVEKGCDTFIATPLLNSLYLWADKRPPTWFNVNGGGIPSEVGPQTQAVSALERAKHPLILVRESEVPGLLGGEPSVQGPLVRYMREDCLEVERVSGFRILAPKRPADRLIGLH